MTESATEFWSVTTAISWRRDTGFAASTSLPNESPPWCVDGIVPQVTAEFPAERSVGLDGPTAFGDDCRVVSIQGSWPSATKRSWFLTWVFQTLFRWAYGPARIRMDGDVSHH